MKRAPSGTTGREMAAGLGLGATCGLVAESLKAPLIFSWWGDQSWTVVAVALLGAGLGALRLRRVVEILALLAVSCWVVVAYSPLTRWLATDLVRDQAPQAADAVFPLASGLQMDGEPTAVALSRLLRAVELVAERRAPLLVISELESPYPSFAAVARQMLGRLGAEVELLSVGPVYNTHDEAVAVTALLRERGLKRLLLVTSPSHSLRASLAFEAEGAEVVSVPALETRFDQQSLARPGDRLAAFGPLLHERLGLIWYRWRGWIH